MDSHEFELLHIFYRPINYMRWLTFMFFHISPLAMIHVIPCFCNQTQMRNVINRLPAHTIEFTSLMGAQHGNRGHTQLTHN